MTSKNLFFKLMKEDFKQRVWLTALISGFFFFTFPVVAMSMASDRRWEMDTAKWAKQYTEYMENLLGVNNGWTVALMVGFAVLCAVTSFSYLHNKSKVDFYHSMPIRREKLFIANYLNGILMMAVPYGIFLVAAVLVGNANHALADVTFRAAGMGFLSHMVFFLAIYSVAVMAMMLTGSRVVALFGMLVLAFILPALTFMTYSYPFLWFQSYYVTSPEPVWIMRLSPFTAYLEYLAQYAALRDDGQGTWGMIGMYLACTAAVSLAIMGLDLLLYRKRPSETAGRAMAFAVSKPIIRIPLVLFSGMSMAAFGWIMWESLGWCVFWLACGCILCHCIIEIIYHSDFKQLFAHPAQLGGCLAVCVLAVCSFRFDWYGYDSYVPDAGDISSARLQFERLDGDWAYDFELKLSSDGLYEVDYTGGSQYILEHMDIKDTEPVLGVAREAVAQLKEQKKDRDWRGMYGVNESEDEEVSYYTSILMEYTLKNGKKAHRYYQSVRINPIMDQVARIYDGDEYKKGAYPILADSRAEQELSYARVSAAGLYEEDIDGLQGEALQEFYRTYREELSGLTIRQRREELPVAMVRFITKEQVESEQQNRRTLLAQGIEMDDNSLWKLDDCSWECPVYPSFKKTLAVLEASGAKLQIKPEDIAGMEIKYQHERDDEQGWINKTIDIESPEEMEQVLSLCGYDDYWSMNWLYRWDLDTYVELTFYRQDEGASSGMGGYDGDGETAEEAVYQDYYGDGEDELKTFSRTYRFPKGQVPDFLQEELRR